MVFSSDLTRYTKIPFPQYRHVPGVTPHPISDPRGHSYRKEPQIDFTTTNNLINSWKSNEYYLYAIDLFNYSYWWEAHEVLEIYWMKTKPSDVSLLFQAIIQLGAALIKWNLNIRGGVKKLSNSGSSKLTELDQKQITYLMGINISNYLTKINEFFYLLLSNKNDITIDFLNINPLITLEFQKDELNVKKKGL